MSQRPPADEAARAAGALPPAHGNRPRVLLVDDSKEHRDLYALMLEADATVITAARGPDALAIAADTPLDVIVLDVLMPIMDGWEVCARLKRNPLTRSIPVIMLTSLDSVESLEPARLAGAAAVLMKPCPIERLAAAIAAVVGERRRLAPAAAAAPNRRWWRKPVTTAVAARASDHPAWLLNVSYGGLCLKINADCRKMPPTFNLIFPTYDAAVSVDVKWLNAAEDGCLCGAEVPVADDAWRAFVDGIR